MKRNLPKVYLASPLGFSESGRLFYYEKLVPLVVEVGFEVLDPWVLTKDKILKPAIALPYGQKKKNTWQKINKIIGQNNAKAIKNCNLILACLDGTDVDSGTASEIGYGAALGKAVIGYRSDFRLSSENEGSTVNLQVEYFIKLNGGTITTDLNELKNTLKHYF
ncbi:MAG: nucleoside 2-deoxyribosyltransferase [bacterium]|nr:nucleoside 2-deoxyribosyltransferase [bacterium]